MPSFRGNQFLRDLAKLSAGSAIGKLIPFLAMPFLTRLYTTESFGLLASYLSVVTTLATVASLRFDIAIALSVDEDEAANLFALSVLTTLILFVMLVIVVALIEPAILHLDLPVLKFVWLLPIGFLIAGLYSPMQLWSTRKRRFGEISWTRISQSIIGTGVSLITGFLGYVPIGLLIGNVLSIGAGSLRLLISALVKDRDALAAVKTVNMKRAFWANIKYPKFSVPGALCNVAGAQLPILLIATHSLEIAGLVFLAMQFMFAPLKIIGAPLSQTFMSRGPEKLKDGTLRSFTLIVMKNSAKSFTPFLLAVSVLLYLSAATVFGDEWRQVGVLALWMVPWAITQCLTSPVSTIGYMVGWQHRLLLFRFSTFLLRFGGTWLAVLFLNDGLIPIVFCLLNFIAYSIMLVFFIAAASADYREVAE